MLKMRTRYLVFVVVVLSALLLIGTIANAKTTLRMWYPWTDPTGGKVWRELLDDFERANPDYEIEGLAVDYQSGQHTKTLTAIAAGNPPDANAFERSAVRRWGVILKALTPLNDYARGAKLNPDDYFPFAWEEVTHAGQIYALPLHTDVRGLYWNKDSFRKAGLDPNTGPTTIAELDRFAERLTVKDSNGRITTMGFIPWGGNWFFFGWGWTFGGDFYDVQTGKATANHPKNVEALEWMVSYAKKYGINQISAFQQDMGGGANYPLITGQAAMEAGNSDAKAYFQMHVPDLDLGQSRVPHPPGGVNGTWSGGFSLVIPRGSKNPEAAWKLISFLGLGEAAQVKWGTGVSAIPTLIAAAMRPEFKDIPFIDYLPESHGRTPLWVLYFNRALSAVDAAIFEKKTAKEALDEVTEVMNKNYAKEFPVK